MTGVRAAGASLMVAVAVVAVGAPSACGRFEAEPAQPDGGARADGAAPLPALRRLSVQLDWPTSTALDPRSLGALTRFDLELFDGDRSVATITVPVTDLGKPVDLGERVTGSRVRVTASGVFGNRLVAYGERADFDVTTVTTVPVAVRRRLLYFTSNDRGDGQLRVVDMAPADLAEPGTRELPVSLPTLRAPTGLVGTGDGRWVVQSGVDRATNKGALEVLSTSDHATDVVLLGFKPALLVPLDGGRRVLVAPSAGTAFAVFEPDTRAVREVYASFQGGNLSVLDAAVHPDRRHVAMAVVHDLGTASPARHVVQYDGVAFTTTRVSDAIAGLRYTRDGASLVLALVSGAVSIRPVADLTAEARRISSPGGDQAVGLHVHPTLPRVYVSGKQRLRVFDLAGPMLYESPRDAAQDPVTGPEFQLTSMARLPYPPRLVLAGQSDSGNDWQQTRLVEIGDASEPRKVELSAPSDVGSASSIVPLFAEPL